MAMPHRDLSRLVWPPVPVGPSPAGAISDAELSQVRSTMTTATLLVGILARLAFAAYPWGSWACWLLALAAGAAVGWWGRCHYKHSGPPPPPC